MAKPRPRHDPHRLFNPEGRRRFRRTYSTAEVRRGAATFRVVVGVTAWAVWKGAHPDPSLFAAGPLGSVYLTA